MELIPHLHVFAASARPCGSVQSVLDEMASVLEDSGRSMRELATDTKEQQREWWRARWARAAGHGKCNAVQAFAKQQHA